MPGLWLALFAGLVQALNVHYTLDASWPKQLPVNSSAFTSVAFDPVYQEVYVLQRGKTVPPVLVFDIAGNLVRSWGGVGPSRLFENEHGLFVQNKGGNSIIWVTDSRNCTVQAFDVFGKQLALLGSPGVCDHSLYPLHFGNVADVTSDGTNLYISDGDGGVNDRILKLDADLNLVWSVGANSTGTKPGEFNSPHSIAWSNGYLYVADRENNRTQIFTDGTGAFYAEFKGGSSGVCQPQTPWSVRTDPANNLLFMIDSFFFPAPLAQSRLLLFDTHNRSTCKIISGIPVGLSDSEAHLMSYDSGSMAIYVAFVNGAPFVQRYVPIPQQP